MSLTLHLPPEIEQALIARAQDRGVPLTVFAEEVLAREVKVPCEPEQETSDLPALVRVDGLWVHQGEPEPGVDWDHIVDDVREERITSILKSGL